MPNNIGAFGENFPYTNQHDMNMDWIIKIAKDFLDQYSTLQESINNGLISIDQEKQNALSEISSELSDALTSIQNETSSEIASAISTINNSADAKLRDTLASIPSDYTDIYNKLVELTADFSGLLASLRAYKVKNFFNPAVLSGISYNGNNCYSYDSNGVTVEQNDSNAVTSSSSMLTLESGTYTVSITNPCRIQVFGNGTVIANVNPGTFATFTINQETNIYIKFIVSSTPTFIGHIQIEKGNQVSPYTPYNDTYFFNQIANYATGVFVTDRIAFLRFQSVSEKVDNQGTVEAGVLKYLDNTITNVGYHTSLDVNAGEMVYFNGFCYGDAFPIVTALYNNEVVGTFYHQL